MSSEKSAAPFITFYSFKGGVGRSMALINTAAILAGRGFRVLVMDLDLEAPGLSYLNPSEAGESALEVGVDPQLQLGFVDLLTDAKEKGPKADLFAMPVVEMVKHYTRAYRLPPRLGEFADGSLHIMPCGRLDSQYARRFDSLNLRELYEQKVGEPLIRAFKRRVAESGLFDYVLVDSRTGFSDEAGICTRDLADLLFILTGLNRQNVEGTSQFLTALRKASDGRVKLQIILSPVPNGEDALVDERERRASDQFREAWGSEVDLSLQIPYHPQLALTEEPHIFRRRRGYLFDAYRRVEERLLTALGHDLRSSVRRARQLISGKDYAAAKLCLGHVPRLDHGRAELTKLANDLGGPWDESPLAVMLGEKSSEPKPGIVELELMLGNEAGKQLIEFLVKNLAVEERSVRLRWFLNHLAQKVPSLADLLFKRVTDAAPADAEALGDYAVFLAFRMKDNERADAYFRRAIEARSDNANQLGNYGAFLLMRGDFENAERLLRQSIELAPKHANSLGNLANLLQRRGDGRAAEAYFKRAIEADPRHANNLGNYARLMMDRDDAKEAERLLKRAMDVDPRNAVNLGNYALLLSRRGDVERAEAFFKQAIDADPTQPNILANYGALLLQLGEREAAEAHLKRALDVDPKNATALGNLAIAIGYGGDHGSAESLFKRAVDMEPSNPSILGQFATFLERQRGDDERAKDFYRRALEAGDKEASFLVNYAQFLAGRGQWPEAETMACSAWSDVHAVVPGTVAEIVLVLWLIRRALGQNATDWERRFKFLVQRGFPRSPWNFDRVLGEAAKMMEPEEFDYARALAEAFLSSAKAANLEQFDRWRALVPLEPRAPGET